MLTLWLPLLNYARSDRPLVERLAQHLPAEGCVRVSGLPRHQLAALESLGGFTLHQGLDDPARPSCSHLLLLGTRNTPPQPPNGWVQIAVERRPTDRQEQTYVFRRESAESITGVR
jgi:hypothetical protein